jgi:phosphatidylglycerophosphatase C
MVHRWAGATVVWWWVVAAPDRPVVAAFDVDHTLTTRDCVVPFLRELGPSSLRTVVTGAGGVLRAGVNRDRDSLKAVVTKMVFAQRRVLDVESAADRHARRIFEEWLRPDTTARLDWHLTSGHSVVLVSASYELYLNPLGEMLGVDAVLGTRLEVDEEVLTGELSGGNCRGPTKRVRLHEWLERHHGRRSAVELWGYGDSSGDAEMLADADRAHLVSGPITRIP